MAHAVEMRAAVLAALLAGSSPAEAAKTFGVPRTTVLDWQRAAGLVGPASEHVLSLVPVENNRHKKKGLNLGELVAAYLQENLITLRVQQEHFRDKEWLQGQNAADLALLHGVAADKAFRILEAIQPGDDSAGA